MFYLGQLFGGLALIILIISFQKNDKEKLLKYQIFSSIFFALQYICLNAVSGCLMNIMSLVRNIIYKKFKDKVPIMFLIVTLICMGVLAIMSYDGWVSMLPVIAVMLYSVALWQKNLTVTRIVELISCVIFIIYNIKIVAFLGLAAAFIEMAFAILAIYRFDVKRLK